MKEGDSLEVCDGAGVIALAELASLDKKGAMIRLIQPPITISKEPWEWTIAVALGSLKGGRADWLVEKAAELGATTLQPLLTVRSPTIAGSDREGEKSAGGKKRRRSEEDEAEDGGGSGSGRGRVQQVGSNACVRQGQRERAGTGAAGGVKCVRNDRGSGRQGCGRAAAVAVATVRWQRQASSALPATQDQAAQHWQHRPACCARPLPAAAKVEAARPLRLLQHPACLLRPPAPLPRPVPAPRPRGAHQPPELVCVNGVVAQVAVRGGHHLEEVLVKPCGGGGGNGDTGPA